MQDTVVCLNGKSTTTRIETTGTHKSCANQQQVLTENPLQQGLKQTYRSMSTPVYFVS